MASPAEIWTAVGVFFAVLGFIAFVIYQLLDGRE